MPETPHIVVTDSQGAVSLRLRAVSPVSRGPITGLGQVVTTGDTAQRADQRTPQVIWTEQRGGMGEHQYVETEGIESFRESDCDTRYAGLIVLPPAAPQLPGVLSMDVSNPIVIEFMGLTYARLLAYAINGAGPGTILPRRHDGFNWVPIWIAGGVGTIAVVTGFLSYNTRFFLTSIGSGTLASDGLYYSDDGLTWTRGRNNETLRGCCLHDNKLYVWNASLSRLEWAAGSVAAAGSAAGWAASTVLLQLLSGEYVAQLIEWRDAQGRAAIYILTTQRLLWYDEDADAIHVFFDFSQQVTGGTTPRAHVWRRDGNLYLVFHNPYDQNTRDTVMWFSGTINQTSPNQRGGIQPAGRVALIGAVGGLHWCYAWGRSPGSDVATPGRLLALNDQQGWHTVYTGLSTVASVIGGGYARGTGWVVLTNAVVYELPLPDNTDSPLFAARTYGTGRTYYHEYAFTDGGTPNMAKAALWVEVVCLDHTTDAKVPGLAATTAVDVEYRRDVDANWITLGTLDPAKTFPAVMPFSLNGEDRKFRQIRIRLGLRSSTAANTPVVQSVSLAYLRQEVPRYAYTVVADLREGDHDFYRGQDRVQLLRRIEGWGQPGSIVRLDFAGGDYASRPAGATTVPNCTVAFSGQEDPDTGPGQYTIVFSDVSPPASG